MTPGKYLVTGNDGTRVLVPAKDGMTVEDIKAAARKKGAKSPVVGGLVFGKALVRLEKELAKK